MAIPKPDPGFESTEGRFDARGNLLDPYVGVTLNNVRKMKTTDLGPTFTFPARASQEHGPSWWYFLREPHPEAEHNIDDTPGIAGPGLYWYRKRRVEALPEERTGKVTEEHIGKDSDLPFIIPVQFLTQSQDN